MPPPAISGAPPSLTALKIAILEDGAVGGEYCGLNNEDPSLTTALLQAGFRVVPTTAVYNLGLRITPPADSLCSHGSVGPLLASGGGWIYRATLVGVGGETVALLKTPVLSPPGSYTSVEWTKLHEAASAELVNALGKSVTALAYAARDPRTFAVAAPVTPTMVMQTRQSSGEVASSGVSAGEVLQVVNTVAQGVQQNLGPAHAESSFAPAGGEHTEHYETPRREESHREETHREETHHESHVAPCRPEEKNCRR